MFDHQRTEAPRSDDEVLFDDHSHDQRARRGRLMSVLMTLALLLGVGGVSVVLAQPASASAYGCTPYTDVRIKGVSPANWCGGPDGSGRSVDSVAATFASSIAGVGYLCNTSMKVEIFDDQGNSVWSANSATTGGCGQAGGAFAIPVGVTLSTDGHVETSLLSYGATIAMISHNIHS